jgi:hypothetical protein
LIVKRRETGEGPVYELSDEEFRLLMSCVGETLEALWNDSELQTRVGVPQDELVAFADSMLALVQSRR